MAYKVNLNYINDAGQLTPHTLLGSHKLTFARASSSLDVSLVEVPNPQGGEGTLNLTLNSAGSGHTTPRSGQAGTWPYEVFLLHQSADGTINKAAHAAGSHFLAVSPATGNLTVTLDELPAQPGINPRLFFTLKDVP